ncbi:hypothetical protein KFL_006680060 [Klebsormidium nitens]|uniref:MYND-type domain-containing protein n=1 Tax=Klebsormidium nitens TaxID=105231 RepID=A0A1Y1IPV2_KLENI|nr:hypothetical protein KFL_006680060 [Klebsormidium nitens]|eukprot:GAQ90657.1 hypothetical protein KFL_006680060 [Klebsormidium nitens]
MDTVRSWAADLLRRFIAAGLVSPGDLVPGSVVHGFVHFEAGVQLPCDQCGALKSPGELKRCSRCKSARYCSAQCQRADWKEHRKTCLV